MKSIFILFLIFLILGLYFFTEPTKGLLSTTGKAVVNVAKSIFKEVKSSEEYNELTQDLKNKTKEQLTKIGGKNADYN